MGNFAVIVVASFDVDRMLPLLNDVVVEFARIATSAFRQMEIAVAVDGIETFVVVGMEQ